MVDEMNNEMTTFDALQVGDVVTGQVTKVEEKHALVDVNYKFDGILPISEISSLHIDKVSDLLTVGEEVTLKVTKLSEEELVLSKKAVEADKAWDDLEQKFQSKETFTVTIADVVKGGLVADLGVRGFMPASLVERHFVESFEDYKGKELEVKIVEFDKEKGKLILSHRAVLEEKANEAKQNTLTSLKEGDVVEGTVQRLTDFGAFVDIGGVDGLVHISQLAHYRVETPSEIVNEGDKVKVKILSVDRDNERISLSIKDTQPGPWEKAAEELHAGDVVEGTVKRLVPFGAFIELLPGVEGLVHISEISHKHIGTPGEVLSEGDKVKVKILDMSLAQKRVSLSIRELEEPEEELSETITTEQEESTGFSFGDVIGDQLKNYK
ncbi:small subunit ribosomal protein S1 [Pullulanibacillus pueri]|uniref:30S ribosomal protein S1 n=1 Tax=Pullulanibacillus pueri TaxID=1437324 RepID=A0A8J3EL00_9BACL|nr:30S ribosomal protein S1 [Pullulanibacillus pueri]MBM7681479.1 small subunit ribosomal protein S1 [Pullulanibacillus pueri]GGH79044.1 30S ribosomal protein S1 [Pullulanibacillus pueri]